MWDSRNGIHLKDRAALLYLVKAMIFAETDQDLQSAYGVAQNDKTAKKNPNFLKHLDEKWKKHNLWSIALRSDIPVRGNNTNNIAEAAI